MSFLGSLFNTIASANTEVNAKQQEYAEQFSQMSDYQLKREYWAMENSSLLNSFVDGLTGKGTDVIARTNALTNECVARGLVISNSEYNQKHSYWASRYSGMNIISLSLDHAKVKRKYEEYHADMMESNSAFYQMSVLKPQLKALKSEYQKRDMNW